MNVIIHGGGIAGLALGRFLAQRGIASTVLERAASHRALGHFIALKSDGVRVLDRLGIRASCEAHAMPTDLNVVLRDSGGSLLREERIGALADDLGGYLLMRRSDLHNSLFEMLPASVDLQFGTGADSMSQDADGVAVRTTDGRDLHADLLIGADGVHSVVRQKVFGDQGIRPLGGTYFALEVDWPGHPMAERVLNVWFGRGRMVAAMATDRDRIMSLVYHGGEDARPRTTTPQAVRELFARDYAEFPPDVRAMFAAIDDHAFVFRDVIQMVTMPSLTAGRVGLVGDAGSCPTFLSGMGSALAMLQAEVLAQQIAEQPSPEQALVAYSAEARAMATVLQRNALRTASIVLDRRWWLAFVRDSLVRFTPRWMMMRRVRRLYDVAPDGSSGL